MKKHTNLWSEVYQGKKPNIDRMNNIIIGLAIGVMITLCGLILAWGLLVERVIGVL
jgi:tetrahydromethanopterin S-methyltransferase subunit G